MNIFREIDAFYGDEQKGRGDPLHSIFRLAGQIRRELGPKGYLLDNYLDLVLQGLNMVVTGEAVEEGTEAAYQFQLKLLSHIVDGTEPEEPHPLFDHVREVYQRYPKIRSFQERRTRLYLLMALAEEELLEHALSRFLAKQERFLIGSGDIVSLNEFYDKIVCFANQSFMEELNQRLQRRLQVTSMLSAFIQGCANDLLFQLTWRDPETSRQIFQLLLDILSEET